VKNNFPPTPRSPSAKGEWLGFRMEKTHQTQSMMEKEMKWSDSDEAINLKLRAFCFDFYLFPRFHPRNRPFAYYKSTSSSPDH
jgi:hypothetical protein